MTAITIRDVPARLHGKLKARAAYEGMSLSSYLVAELREIASKPTLAELRERLGKHAAVDVKLDSARLIREERDRR